jgi:DnaK suppressor protein
LEVSVESSTNSSAYRHHFAAFCFAFLSVDGLFSNRYTIVSLWPLNCQLQGMRETSSANHELNRFQAVLEALVAELERGISQRDGIAVEQSPDQVDEIQRASERALATCNVDRESKQLRTAHAAHRIREGSFGVCDQCEAQIHARRLAAIPWASLCIQCQEAIDCRREAMPISTDSLQVNAA